MSGLEMKYFVLNPRARYPGDVYALASRMAMEDYAGNIAPIDPDLAQDLRAWVERERCAAADLNVRRES